MTSVSMTITPSDAAVVVGVVVGFIIGWVCLLGAAFSRQGKKLTFRNYVFVALGGLAAGSLAYVAVLVVLTGVMTLASGGR